METTTIWKNDMAFISEFDGHLIELNGASGADGKRLGFGPKALLLSGLAGCSGIDVVEMLHKMKVFFSKFEIHTEADLVDDSRVHDRANHLPRRGQLVAHSRLTSSLRRPL